MWKTPSTSRGSASNGASAHAAGRGFSHRVDARFARTLRAAGAVLSVASRGPRAARGASAPVARDGEAGRRRLAGARPGRAVGDQRPDGAGTQLARTDVRG